MENIYIKQDLCIDFNCKIKLILFYVISGVLFISNKFQSYFLAVVSLLLQMLQNAFTISLCFYLKPS